MVPKSPLNFALNIPSRPLFIYVLDGDHLQPTTFQSNYQLSQMKTRHHSVTPPHSFSKTHSSGIWHLNLNVGASTHIAFRPRVSANVAWNYSIDEECQVDSASDYNESLDMDANKELERRRKIGLANKGKVPWNKGKKHSAATRELIKQRTIEALQDPKVRKKMAEGHQAHSDEIKAKIGLGQKRVWRKRFKIKKLQERFYRIWAEGIAEAAKRGWRDQDELEWDSYEKLTAEIALQHLQFAADKEKAKEVAKLRTARKKAERMVKRALLKKEKEEKAKSIEAKRRIPPNPKEDNQELPISKGLKLKARITKIRRKKLVDGQATITGELPTSHQPTIEKLDLEFIRREKLRRETSLADQIQAAKKKRVDCATKEAQMKASSSFILNGRVEQMISTIYTDGP